jgi:2'-hydroxyisoflavone reductase
MLAPGDPSDPIQVMDVRDLARWMVQLVDNRTTGTFNADSPPHRFTMGELMRASLSASPAAHTRVTWVPAPFLAARPEDLDFTPWSAPTGSLAFAGLIATQRAQRAGLQVRPLADTVRDTLAWFQSLPAQRQSKLRAGVDPRSEMAVLGAWHEHAAAAAAGSGIHS